jgi:hypothetical protein
LGDNEDVTIEKHSPFVLDYVATMFFGVDFESIDPRRLLVVELKVTDATAEGEE